MLQLYIKYTDNNYYLLDLDPKENINFKVTVKDLNDITKIFSPFTQSFNLDATDKNKRLCGFIGNEKIQRINNTGEFNSLIYVAGFLFQSGKLTFDETDYEFKNQKSFKTNFASNLTSLTEKLGDSTIQDLFLDVNGDFDREVKINWGLANNIIQKRMAGIRATTMLNGVVLKYGVPFISNKRIWTYDDINLDKIDNIAYNLIAKPTTYNFITPDEVRPAVSYLTILELLIKKIGVPITCPIFETPEIKELYAWCNSENLVPKSDSNFEVTPYSTIVKVREDTKDEIPGSSLPSIPKWIVTETLGVFKIERNETVLYPKDWSDGFDITVTFDGLASVESNETTIKVEVVRDVDNYVLDSEEITSNKYTFRCLDIDSNNTQLDTNGELYFKIQILPINLVKWNTITVENVQKVRRERKVAFGSITQVLRATFRSTSTNSTPSENLGGFKLNLATALPAMKCVDFLKSFFKTFNISVISTGKNDQSMYWVTPNNIKEINKPYSKRIVDYTNYVDIASISKKKANQYNQFYFSHFKSKYYEAIYGNGKLFGELSYPEIKPTKPNKFEVKTDYSIIKQASTFNHPSGARTCLGFSKDSPEILDNGALRYKPVYEELTLFYLKPKVLAVSTSDAGLNIQFTDTVNKKIYAILEASFKCSNGKTIAFGAEDIYTDSLYLNHYKDFIELLLKPNTYKTEFTLNLPPNEIFLNFANTRQNEGNIPVGFRPQNEIIISEQRYQLIDSTIELTSGKTKLTALNF
jgi:hypothetical protein